MNYTIDFNNKLNKESDEGNIEYKLKLINLDNNTINKRVTQMKYRLYEGNGECIYYIGIQDDGTPIGLTIDEYKDSEKNLNNIVELSNATIIKLSEHEKNNYYIGVFLIREYDNKFIDIKIAVAGNVDSSKSTTISVLSRGILDDGNGSARTSIFSFKHEIESGRTTSVGHHIVGFDKNGDIININKNNTYIDIMNKATKIITFYDLCGHQKYLKNTIYGLSSSNSDYALIMIGGNMGISQMTREHIALCINLKIPFIILVTKIDITPQNILEENMQKINNMCKNRIRKAPYIIKNMSDILTVIKNIKSDSIVPIIQISNVTNYNLDLLKSLLNLLPIRNDYSQNINKPVEMLVDNTYSTPGHATIVSGLLKSGTVRINDNLVIGPFFDQTYRQVKVRSIHLNYKDIKEASPGSFICLSLKNITRKEIKKGMVIISDNNELKIAVKQFIVQIHVLHSPTMIQVGYQPYVHIEHIRQSVIMLEINKENSKDNNDKILRTGDKATVKLQFAFTPAYIKPGMKLIFREGLVKAVGKIIQTL